MNHDLWDDLDQPPHVSSVQVGPHELSTGDRVRLHPQGRADIMDLALAGKIAVIEAIEHDFEGASTWPSSWKMTPAGTWA